MTIGVEIATELLKTKAGENGYALMSSAHHPNERCYLWTFEKEGSLPAYVTITERELALNVKSSQVDDLISHRLNIGMITARNSK